MAEQRRVVLEGGERDALKDVQDGIDDLNAKYVQLDLDYESTKARLRGMIKGAVLRRDEMVRSFSLARGEDPAKSSFDPGDLALVFPPKPEPAPEEPGAEPAASDDGAEDGEGAE